MGAWGVGTFDNDDSLDWMYELEESSDLSVVERALSVSGDYIESPEATAALAAVEVVLGLIGKPSPNLPDELNSWLEKNSSLNAEKLIPKAAFAAKTVCSDKSELKELWEETDDYHEWKNTIESMLLRLDGG